MLKNIIDSFIKCIKKILNCILGEKYSPKDVIDFFILIFSIIFIIIGIFWNKTYYENILVQFFPMNREEVLLNNKNIVDEVELGIEQNKIVLVSSPDSSLKIDLKQFDTMNGKEAIYKKASTSKKLEPGDSLMISYTESEGIPNYVLYVSTDNGNAKIKLDYNGRYGNVNKTKIKATRSMNSYLLDKLFK